MINSSEPQSSTLTMKMSDGAPMPVAWANREPLEEYANAVVRALTIIGFRSVVTLAANGNDGRRLWESVITFTDDIPDGTWSTVRYDIK